MGGRLLFVRGRAVGRGDRCKEGEGNKEEVEEGGRWCRLGWIEGGVMWGDG